MNTSKLSQNDQVSAAETAELLRLAERCLAVEGDFVELGCYRGDTSVLLGKLLAATPRRLFIYDSFAGLPAKSAADLSGAGANFTAGSLLVTKRSVIDTLHRHHLRNVVVKKAWFGDLAPSDLPATIAFAFIDGDFYKSQTQGLRLVAPALAKQGIIICHDYNNPELPGATRAVDEFLRQHPAYRLKTYHTLAILTRPS